MSTPSQSPADQILQIARGYGGRQNYAAFYSNVQQAVTRNPVGPENVVNFRGNLDVLGKKRLPHDYRLTRDCILKTPKQNAEMDKSFEHSRGVRAGDILRGGAVPKYIEDDPDR